MKDNGHEISPPPSGAPHRPAQHYFSSEPLSAQNLRELRVTLAGRELDLVTAAGIFSPDHVDLGTRVLLRKVPAPAQEGNLLDLGCGWGPISLTMALESPRAHVWAVDVNTRAVEIVRRNAQRAGIENITACTPDEVPTEVEFATIWSNPPVRIGKAALQELVSQWLGRLIKDGEAWLVIQRHLGADSLHRWLAQNWEVERAGSAKGFRVLQVKPRN